MRDALDDLRGRTSLIVIASAIALGYALLEVGEGAAALVLSAATETRVRGGLFDSARGPLSLEVGGRALEFAQLVSGLVTLAVVLGAVLYVFRWHRRARSREEAVPSD